MTGTAVKTYNFELEEIQGVAEVERFIEALGELKKDDTLQIEERKLVIITTKRADVASVLEGIFKPAEIKRTWSRKPKPESNITFGNNGNKLTGIPEPGGIPPYHPSPETEAKYNA